MQHASTMLQSRMLQAVEAARRWVAFPAFEVLGCVSAWHQHLWRNPRNLPSIALSLICVPYPGSRWTQTAVQSREMYRASTSSLRATAGLPQVTFRALSLLLRNVSTGSFAQDVTRACCLSLHACAHHSDSINAGAVIDKAPMHFAGTMVTDYQVQSPPRQVRILAVYPALNASLDTVS